MVVRFNWDINFEIPKPPQLDRGFSGSSKFTPLNPSFDANHAVGRDAMLKVISSLTSEN